VQLLENFPAFYGTQRFITEFTRALHWSLSWAKPTEAILPHTLSSKSTLTLSNHLHFGLSSGLFSPGFLTSSLYAFLFSSVCATWHACLILLDLIILVRPDEVTNFFIMHLSLTSYHFISPWSKFFTHTKPQANLQSCIF
jgi:hypothetical protein